MITREKLEEILKSRESFQQTKGLDHKYYALEVLRYNIPYEVCDSIIGCAEHDTLYLCDVEQVLPYIDEEEAYILADCTIFPLRKIVWLCLPKNINEIMKNEIKELDYFTFKYNQDYLAKHQIIVDPYHCFDGKLIARKTTSGEIFLEDTYWEYGDNETFTIEEALKSGELTFVCNLNDVKEISKYDIVYYADKDVIDLSHQHGCYTKYAIRNNTTRSKEKMTDVIIDRIRTAEQKIMSCKRDIEYWDSKLKEIDNGVDLNKIYI